ncbi:hypothetical protein [Peromfec virus RodF8_40]|uniref:Uncharacterized protein n=1 Tax=Peromfec virus RodF8_40 TaxID=2929374 RepID=A0A976N1Q8_9VIRU|nr:hypothetical protein [Peromfec virus RodF8_40]
MKKLQNQIIKNWKIKIDFVCCALPLLFIRAQLTGFNINQCFDLINDIVNGENYE